MCISLKLHHPEGQCFLITFHHRVRWGLAVFPVSHRGLTPSRTRTRTPEYTATVSCYIVPRIIISTRIIASAFRSHSNNALNVKIIKLHTMSIYGFIYVVRSIIFFVDKLPLSSTESLKKLPPSDLSTQLSVKLTLESPI